MKFSIKLIFALLLCMPGISRSQDSSAITDTIRYMYFSDSLEIVYSDKTLKLPLNSVTVRDLIRYALLPSKEEEYICRCEQGFSKCSWFICIDKENFVYLYIRPRYPEGFSWDIYEGEGPRFQDILDFPVWYLYLEKNREIVSTRLVIKHSEKRVDLIGN